MIKFVRFDKTKLRIEVDTGIRVDKSTFNFTFGNLTYQANAELMRQHLQDALGDLFKKAREASYNEGWKDAKAKRRKRKWFSISQKTE